MKHGLRGLFVYRSCRSCSEEHQIQIAKRRHFTAARSAEPNECKVPQPAPRPRPR